MPVYSTSSPSRLVLVGIAFLAGACVLAWFSSVATLEIARTSPTYADVTIVDRLFGKWPIASERFEGVRAARSVASQAGGSTSRTTNTRFLVFDTVAGETYAGPTHHFFARDVGAISEFFDDPSRRTLTLRTTDRDREFFRFLFAQLCVVSLAIIGAVATWRGVRGLFSGTSPGTGRA